MNTGNTCPDCSKMGSLAHFCNKCGEALPQKPIDPKDRAEEEAVFEEIGFKQCGRKGHALQAVVVKAKFCSTCGEKFNFVE